ncbi:fibronectin type III domain-containing protein [candidate division KSB1 bacterium]|nr:fibronectin type III domain-containing protein [candidate division KSB1 bacterium]
MKAIARLFIPVMMGVLLILLLIRCDRTTSPMNPNIPPNTTLANIPVEEDTLFALVTLHWDGEDDDGFISGYEYRYITHHETVKDSLVQAWTYTKETSVTIPFESSDLLNYQKFQVRAVDNNNVADPSPAEKKFFTVQTIFPETQILTPRQNQQFFAIDHTTDWWFGVQLTFTAHDEDGEVVEFAWTVDNGEWNWTTDTTLFITPDNFETLGGDHVIHVTSRDNTNLIDPVGDSVKVKLVVPTFEKKLLIIDETVESKFPFGITSKDADVDAFYTEIFAPDDTWDFQKQGMPAKELLGQYKLVLWHADNLYTYEGDVHKLPQHISDIMDYVNVGGDFIMSGWRILKSFAVRESFPKTFEEGSFIHDYLHIIQADESAPIPDFTSAKGYGVFTDIRVDSFKLSESYLTSIPVVGLPYVNVMPLRAGFTEVIYRYQNDDNTGIPAHRMAACGLRYYGTSFNAVVLGFPMFFINKEDAQKMATQMLQSLGY